MRDWRWRSRLTRSIPCWVTTSVLIAIFATGVPLASSVPAGAQPPGWECPAPTVETSPVAASPAAAADPASAFPVDGGDLTVFAAASLTDAFTQIQTDLQAANPDVAIVYNFGSSSTLATQLTEGAVADIFASANTAQMDAAVAAGLVSGEPVAFVRNRLAIVAPADNPAGIDSPDDLAGEGLRLVLAQAEVPAGRYAREAVCVMGSDSAAYGGDFVARVAANVVSEEEDVRDVLAKVVLGEADAGIVYVSDAAAAGDQVHVVDIPDDVNILATYPVAALVGGDQALASAFIAHLLSEEGQATLAEFGFDPLS
jgi:molybdate transport system substrate-binding protein